MGEIKVQEVFDRAGRLIGTVERTFERDGVTLVKYFDVEGRELDMAPDVYDRVTGGRIADQPPSITSDQIAGIEPMPTQRCERCGGPATGPGTIPGRGYGALVCSGCALNGSDRDRLMAGLVRRPRGRPRKEQG